MVPDITGRVAVTCVVSVFLCVRAVAQEGYYGVGHDRWHMEFYSKLNRNDGKGTCCNLMDCRPTQRVKVDGKWMPVPNDRINNVAAFNFRIDAALSLGLQFSLKRLQLSNMPLGLRRGRVEAVSERSARHRRLGGLSLR